MAYVGFGKLKSELAARGNVRDPGALAAYIERKKYDPAAIRKAQRTGTSLRGKLQRNGKKKRGRR